MAGISVYLRILAYMYQATDTIVEEQTDAFLITCIKNVS